MEQNKLKSLEKRKRVFEPLLLIPITTAPLAPNYDESASIYESSAPFNTNIMRAPASSLVNESPRTPFPKPYHLVQDAIVLLNV